MKWNSNWKVALTIHTLYMKPIYRFLSCWPVPSVSALQEEDRGAFVSEGPPGDNLQWSPISFGCWQLNVDSSWSSLRLSAPSWSNSWFNSFSWAVTRCSVGVLLSVGSGLVQKLVSDDGCTSGSGSMVAVSTIPLPSGVHLPDGWTLLGCPASLEIHTYIYSMTTAYPYFLTSVL